MREYKRKIEGLKSVEVLCYSLCIQLLAEEVLATEAAKAALLDLFADDRFWLLEGAARNRQARRRAIARAMELLANPSSSRT